MRSVSFRSIRVGILFKYKLISLGESMHPCLTPLHHESGLNARKQLLHNFYTSSIFEKYLTSLNIVTKFLSLKQRPYFLCLTRGCHFSANSYSF